MERAKPLLIEQDISDRMEIIKKYKDAGALEIERSVYRGIEKYAWSNGSWNADSNVFVR